jgi:membrane fusion protein, multidrug efflux system
MNKKIIISALIPVVLAGTLLTCQNQEKESKEATALPVDESAVAVSVTAVKSGDYSLPVNSSGLISTETESRLSFKVPGIVSRILVKEGESVSAGQLLATLDLTEIDAQVALTRNGLEKSKRDLERGQHLYKDSAATLEQIQNLQTAHDVAQENFRIASFNRQYSMIHAPSGGKVIKKYLNEGELANPGTAVLVVNSSAKNNWIVKVGLPDVDWVRIRKGDKAVITMDAYPGVSFDGTVGAINEGADAVNGLYQAEVNITPGGNKLASGLFAKVMITPSGKSQSKSIPIEAIVEGNGKNAFVFVPDSDGKTVRKVPVTVLYLTPTEAVISKGLDDVAEVVTGGSAFLTETSTITVTR